MNPDANKPADSESLFGIDDDDMMMYAAVGVVIVILLAGAWYYYTNYYAPASTTPVTTTPGSTTPGSTTSTPTGTSTLPAGSGIGPAPATGGVRVSSKVPLTDAQLAKMAKDWNSMPIALKQSLGLPARMLDAGYNIASDPNIRFYGTPMDLMTCRTACQTDSGCNTKYYFKEMGDYCFGSP